MRQACWKRIESICDHSLVSPDKFQPNGSDLHLWALREAKLHYIFSADPRPLDFFKANGDLVTWKLSNADSPQATMTAEHDPSFVLHPSAFFPDVMRIPRNESWNFLYTDVMHVKLGNALVRVQEVPSGQPSPRSPERSIVSADGAPSASFATPKAKSTKSTSMSAEKRVLSQFGRRIVRKFAPTPGC